MPTQVLSEPIVATRSALRNGRLLRPSPEHLAIIDRGIAAMTSFEMRAGAGATRVSAVNPQQGDVPGAPPLSDSDRIASLEARVSVLEKRVEQIEEPAPAGPPVAPADPNGPSASAPASPTMQLDTEAIFSRFNGKALAAKPTISATIDVAAVYGRMRAETDARARGVGRDPGRRG